MGDALVIGLATWALVWMLSFWYKTERFRSFLGIHMIVEDSERGRVMDREDCGGLGSWVNCPACCSVLCLPVVFVIFKLLPEGAALLAAVGVAVAISRWWESARVKAEWWM